MIWNNSTAEVTHNGKAVMAFAPKTRDQMQERDSLLWSTLYVRRSKTSQQTLKNVHSITCGKEEVKGFFFAGSSYMYIKTYDSAETGSAVEP